MNGNYNGGYGNYGGGYGGNGGGYGGNGGSYGGNGGGYGGNYGGYSGNGSSYGNNVGGYGNYSGSYGNYGGNGANNNQQVISTKKFNLGLFFSCLLAGLVGFVIAEVVFRIVRFINSMLAVGLFIGIVGFFVLMAAAIHDIITGRMRPENKRAEGKAQPIILALLFSIALFGAGCLFQFLYSLDGISGAPTNYIIMIDNSGSALDTDPDFERFDALENFIEERGEGNSFSVICFSDKIDSTLPLTKYYKGMGAAVSEEAREKFKGGGTNIQLALDAALAEGRKADGVAVAILFSDGDSSVNVESTCDSYTKAHMQLFTVEFSMTNGRGSELLNTLADNTGGKAIKIGNGVTFEDSFNQILKFSNGRNLLTPRSEEEISNVPHIIIRIVLIFIISFGAAPFIGLILDNYDALKASFIIRAISAPIVAVLVEFAFFIPLFTVFTLLVRLLFTIIFSVVCCNYVESKRIA